MHYAGAYRVPWEKIGSLVVCVAPPYAERDFRNIVWFCLKGTPIYSRSTRNPKDPKDCHDQPRGLTSRKNVQAIESTLAGIDLHKAESGDALFISTTDDQKFYIRFFDSHWKRENSSSIQPSSLWDNVLNKEQTLMEKLASLIRFSFDANAKESIASKIRHFYDLYYLMNAADCAAFVKSVQFKKTIWRNTPAWQGNLWSARRVDTEKYTGVAADYGFWKHLEAVEGCL